MAIPIIFIHRTDSSYLIDSSYLSITLQQAKLSNPYSEIILIGDKTNHHYPFVKHYSIDNFSMGAREFEKVYQHLSINTFQYELFCFQRWFILRDFMKANEINECLSLDTDVMLYTNMDCSDYKDLSYEWTWTTITNLEELEKYCEFILNLFNESKLYLELQNYTKQIGHFNRETGSIILTDMATHGLYVDRILNRKRKGGIFSNTFFDINFSTSFPGVETLDNKKKVFIMDGSLFCKRLNKDDYIKVNSLHFQGPSGKRLVHHFFGPKLSVIPKGSYFFDYKSCEWVPIKI